MNGSLIYEAMGGIRPVYVEEAEKQSFAKPLWRKALPLAACLAVIMGISLGLLQLGGWHVSGLPAGLPQILPEPPAITPEHELPAQAFYYQRTNLQFILNMFAIVLGISCFAVSFLSVLKHASPRKTHIRSCVLYLGYLIACICSVWLSVSQAWWDNLYQDLPLMLKYGVLLLIVSLILNGLLYLKNRKLAILLAMAACFLFLLGPKQEHNQIEAEAVIPAKSSPNGPQLVELIEQYGGTRTIPMPSDHPAYEYTVATIAVEDGSYYTLAYIYDNDFSFNPFHFGEDSAHYRLTKFTDYGRAAQAWKLHRDFEPAYRKLEVTPP